MNHQDQSTRGRACWMLALALATLPLGLAAGDPSDHSAFLPAPARAQLENSTVFSWGERRELLFLDMAGSTTDTLAVAEVRGTLAERIAPEFRRYMLFFLKPEFVPPVESIRAGLKFIGSEASKSGADVAYLDYEAGGRQLRVAQTGQDNSGSIAICAKFGGGELNGETTAAACRKAILELLGQLLVEDPDASFGFGPLTPAGGDGYWIKPEDDVANYRRHLDGTVDSEAVAILFHRKHPWYRVDQHNVRSNPPIPRWSAPPDEWFDHQLSYRAPRPKER